MTQHDDARHADEMPDDELDQILAAANRELLAYIEARADGNHTLAEIMTQNVEAAPPPSRALDYDRRGSSNSVTRRTDAAWRREAYRQPPKDGRIDKPIPEAIAIVPDMISPEAIRPESITSEADPDSITSDAITPESITSEADPDSITSEARPDGVTPEAEDK